MKLATHLLMAVSIAGCATAAQNTQPLVATSIVIQTSTPSESTEITGTTGSSTSTLAPMVAESLVTASTSIQQAPVSTMKLTTTTVASTSRPKLSVSQTTNLNPNGTSVTVRGSGYDISKGVYVIVCTQAAPGTQSTCVGGINIDG